MQRAIANSLFKLSFRFIILYFLSASHCYDFISLTVTSYSLGLSTQYKRCANNSPVTKRYLGELPETDEIMEEWLDDMIYSGDVEGFIRRKTSDVLTENFYNYLEERLTGCHDEDELQVLSEVRAAVFKLMEFPSHIKFAEDFAECELDDFLQKKKPVE
jgi:hypothetical protein